MGFNFLGEQAFEDHIYNIQLHVADLALHL